MFIFNKNLFFSVILLLCHIADMFRGPIKGANFQGWIRIPFINEYIKCQKKKLDTNQMLYNKVQLTCVLIKNSYIVYSTKECDG